jgi:hypothetical protein
VEYFILVTEAAGKKRKKVVLTTKAKIGLFMTLLGTLIYTLSIIF